MSAPRHRGSAHLDREYDASLVPLNLFSDCNQVVLGHLLGVGGYPEYKGNCEFYRYGGWPSTTEMGGEILFSRGAFVCEFR